MEQIKKDNVYLRNLTKVKEFIIECKQKEHMI